MAFSTNGAPGSDRLSSEINVAPLIDVLLVMLIIFMVIVPVMPRGLNTALPATASAGDEAPDSPILVEVEQGAVTVRYRINGIEVEKTRIAPGLAELVSRRPSRRMVLKADAKLDFAVIAGVIDAGRAAGAESIGLWTPGADAPSR